MAKQTTALSLTLTLLLSGISCSSSSTGPSGNPKDFSGMWDISGEVVAKRTCFYAIGQTLNWNGALITQVGNRGTISLGGRPYELIVDGPVARASWSEDVLLEFEFTIARGELGGTLTVSGSNPSGPCTEILELSGERTNLPPAAEFAGYWDLSLSTISSNCKEKSGLPIEVVCVQITRSGNRVLVDDGIETIAGVGSAETAVLASADAEGYLEMTLTVSGNTLSGQLTDFDLVEACTSTLSITGTRREAACEPPAERGSGRTQ